MLNIFLGVKEVSQDNVDFSNPTAALFLYEFFVETKWKKS